MSLTTDEQEQLRATLAALEHLSVGMAALVDELTKIAALAREGLEFDVKRKRPLRR